MNTFESTITEVKDGNLLTGRGCGAGCPEVSSFDGVGPRGGSELCRISKRYLDLAPAPIAHLHRHRDGYIAFATERDGDDFRPLVSIRATELDTVFPAFREALERDAYVGINGDWRLRSYGECGASYGYPLHRNNSLRYINACYVDIDYYKVGLDIDSVLGCVIKFQESGQLPHVSMFVRSGNGLWLLWLVRDVESPDVSQRAFTDKLELYARIQAAIIERLLPLGADMSACDAARHLRIPGSFNTSAERSVEWWVQGQSPGGYTYTLPELALLFKTTRTKRHSREIQAHKPACRSGWVALNAKRLRDFNTLRALRGGFSDGCRNNALKIFAWLLRVNAVPKADILELVRALGGECHPRTSDSEARSAWKYTQLRSMRSQRISDWLCVTPAESEVLEGLPPASFFGFVTERRPRRSIDSIRQAAQERRAAIQEIISNGSVSSTRQLAAILASKGISGNHVTVWRDLHALGMSLERAHNLTATDGEGAASPALF